jgi:hypothetical protein
MKLTAKAVEKLRHEGALHFRNIKDDGAPGLYLRILASGGKALDQTLQARAQDAHRHLRRRRQDRARESPLKGVRVTRHHSRRARSGSRRATQGRCREAAADRRRLRRRIHRATRQAEQAILARGRTAAPP